MTSKRPSGKARAAQALAAAARLPSRLPGSFDLKEVAAEDVGNIFRLEHVNLRVPDHKLATIFYVMGLGFTRDPHFVVGVDNMWVNVGETQYHLPLNTAQVLRGRIGMVVPDLEGLVMRLDAVAGRLAGTQFAWARDRHGVSVTCPWGNRMRCFLPSATYPGLRMGIAEVQLDVPRGAAAGIARFYRQVLDTPAQLRKAGGLARATVLIGGNQHLVFAETDAPLPAFDGHHIAVYVANMSKSFAWLHERGVIQEGLSRHQYRFTDLIDPATGEKVFELEHEVRSFRHPMFLRPLINRDPDFIAGPYSGGERRVPNPHWGL